MRIRWYVGAAALVLAAVIGMAVVTSYHPASYDQPQSGGIGSTLVTPDGASIKVDRIERSSSVWRFHVHVHNTGSQALTIVGTGQDHQFALIGAAPAGTPADQSMLVLTMPVGSDIATHPALPASVRGQGDVDGWLTANLAAFKYTPTELVYRYGTFHTTACKNPQDKSTCHPADLYRVIEWTL